MPDLWMDVDVALAEVPVNIMPLLDDTDFKTRETAVAFNAAGMDLVWNFVTPAGAMTQTAVVPTSAGVYDWTHQGDGMYSIEIPASGGGSINNDTEGFGWFSGVATGVLPWRGPIIGFRAAGLNNLLIEDAFSSTRGLAGTALPNAVADAAGGLPISDAGGLDLDGRLDTNVGSRLSTAGYTAPDNAGIAAIKAKTDQMVFTIANKLDSSIQAAGDFAQAAADKVWSTAARTLTAFGFSVTVGTNNDKTGYALSTAGVDAIHDDEVETGVTFREAARLGVAHDSGKTNGAGTATFNIRNIADTKNRIQATTDGSGNRTAVTRDLT